MTEDSFNDGCALLCYLPVLPRDMLHTLLLYLSVKDLLAMSQSCRTLNTFIDFDEDLWKEAYVIAFGAPCSLESTSKLWKSLLKSARYRKGTKTWVGACVKREVEKCSEYGEVMAFGSATQFRNWKDKAPNHDYSYQYRWQPGLMITTESVPQVEQRFFVQRGTYKITWKLMVESSARFVNAQFRVSTKTLTQEAAILQTWCKTDYSKAKGKGWIFFSHKQLLHVSDTLIPVEVSMQAGPGYKVDWVRILPVDVQLKQLLSWEKQYTQSKQEKTHRRRK